MSRASHTILGAVAGAGTSFIEQIQNVEVTQSQSIPEKRLDFSLSRLARSAAVGALAAMLPVPSKQAQRRVVARVIAMAAHWGAKLPPGNMRSDLSAILAGYGSHLVANACTRPSRS